MLTWSLELSRKRKFIQDRQEFFFKLSFEQKNSKHVRLVPLSVSQNTALERLDKDFAVDSKVSMAIYTCGKYVLLIGSVAEKIFLVDSHPVVENAGGQHTGVAIFSEGHMVQCHKFICEWLIERLKRSGVASGNMQSFAIMT